MKNTIKMALALTFSTFISFADAQASGGAPDTCGVNSPPPSTDCRPVSRIHISIPSKNFYGYYIIVDCLRASATIVGIARVENPPPAHEVCASITEHLVPDEVRRYCNRCPGMPFNTFGF